MCAFQTKYFIGYFYLGAGKMDQALCSYNLVEQIKRESRYYGKSNSVCWILYMLYTLLRKLVIIRQWAEIARINEPC